MAQKHWSDKHRNWDDAPMVDGRPALPPPPKTVAQAWREVTFFGRVILVLLLGIVLPPLVVVGGLLFVGIGDAFGLW